MMFSKALFKQSSKANGIMWLIVTTAVCFILACLMIISGSGNLSNMKNSIEDSIIVDTIESNTTNKALNNYRLDNKYMAYFDEIFVNNTLSMIDNNEKNKVLEYKSKLIEWYKSKPSLSIALPSWKDKMPKPDGIEEQILLKYFADWINEEPKKDGISEEEYNTLYKNWQENIPTASMAIVSSNALNKEMMTKIYEKSILDLKTKIMAETNDDNLVNIVLFTMNPNSMADDEYNKIEQGSAPKAYDVENLIINISNEDYKKIDNDEKPTNTINYILGVERYDYRISRSQYAIPMLIADKMNQEEMIKQLIDELSVYNVDREKYDSFGFTYESVKKATTNYVLTYEVRLKNEIEEGKNYTSVTDFYNQISSNEEKLLGTLSSSLLDTLPTDVSTALEEIGQMDLYSLMIGSIFFKIAGLLLPIIYMIMTANNLIAGQVDSGSMAYILATSTKRESVSFTQACYLIISLFLMFLCTAVTSVICFSIINITNTNLTYAKLILINLDAFLVLFSLSGINFFTSSYFDKTKKSMAIGGGLSMFFLVATMLGLFGSPVIPAVVRIDALNNFNYVSLISLFDAVSIIDGTNAYIWKMAILALIGIVFYIAGAIKFKRKDLPL